MRSPCYRLERTDITLLLKLPPFFHLFFICHQDLLWSPWFFRLFIKIATTCQISVDKDNWKVAGIVIKCQKDKMQKWRGHFHSLDLVASIKWLYATLNSIWFCSSTFFLLGEMKEVCEICDVHIYFSCLTCTYAHWTQFSNFSLGFTGYQFLIVRRTWAIGAYGDHMLCINHLLLL